MEAPLDALIVGAGFGGLAAAIECKDHGLKHIEVIDAASGVGGTWRLNTYPGAACDVPSQLYSYSFAQRRDWKRLCPAQPDILSYIKDVAREKGLNDLITPDTRATACSWDQDSALWTTTTDTGRSISSRVVILATGQLHQPSTPTIEGAEDFAGEMFHSAEWNHDINLAGKRVAVVGTGASAVQFVPEVAETAAHLDVYQRSGNWFMARRNRTYPKPVQLAIRWVPGLQAFRRAFITQYAEAITLMIRHPRTWGQLGRLWSTIFMRWQVKDPVLRTKLWPDYTFGCKRVLFSSFFLPALQRPNVDLLTEPISSITPTGIVTSDGVEHNADVLIWGTGFKTTDFMFPMKITGRSGKRLEDAWANGPHAHLGMTVPGFPSLFIMYGPNTNTSGGSILVFLEAQAGYIRQAILATNSRRAAAVEVKPEVELQSDLDTQASFEGTAWLRCNSWYRDSEGRVVTNWPRYMSDYVQQTDQFDPAEFDFISVADS